MTEDLYGLRGRPFGPEIDAAYYFEGRAQDRALSWLAYGLADGNAFLAILGEPGVGKSMLGAHLAATVEPERVSAGSLSARTITDIGVLAAVAGAFGLPASPDDAHVVIEAFLHDAARAGKRCVLVIDDAQEFAPSALDEVATLATFRLGGQALLHTVLLARPGLEAAVTTRASDCALRRSLESAHRLGPIEADEVGRYIEHRLRRAGWQGNPALEPELFHAIHTASGGIAARVNRICERLLLLGAVDQRARVDHAMLEAVIGELGGEFADAGRGASVNEVAPLAVNLMARLAHQDEQIRQLSEALRALGEPVQHTVSDAERIAALEARLSGLETALRDQERAICQALTTLIDWAEADTGRRFAA